MPQPSIDAVITWVDGNDPVLAEKRAKYQTQATAFGGDTTRFASMDEILYCVVSILRFAPFIRKIFIITDEQKPGIFDYIGANFPDQASKIEIVDHKQIFQGYEDCLPTFNSTSIISMLHRIPDLSNHFVFFNDDMVLARAVTPEDFFVDGKPVQRGGWMGRSLPVVEWLKSRLDDVRGIPKEKRRLTSKGRMMTAARLTGFKTRTFIATHAPYAMRRTTLTDFETSHRQLWAQNASYRFRSQEQFPAEAIAFHQEFKTGNAVQKDRKELVYIREVRRDLSKIQAKLDQIDTDESIKFACIQNLDRAPKDVLDTITHWLNSRILLSNKTGANT
jgi:hypothetical protein